MYLVERYEGKEVYYTDILHTNGIVHKNESTALHAEAPRQLCSGQQGYHSVDPVIALLLIPFMLRFHKFADIYAVGQHGIDCFDVRQTSIDTIHDVVRKLYKYRHSKAHLTRCILVPLSQMASHVGMPFRLLLRCYPDWCVIITPAALHLAGHPLLRLPQHISDL
jgi:hypothetical protein